MPENEKKKLIEEPGFGVSTGGAVDTSQAVLDMYANAPQAQPEQAETPEVQASVANPYLDEIHRYESEKNYKALLNSNIAAYNMKLNAQKYLNNSLANQGLSTQGYGSSARTGIENQYANMYAQNQQAYNESQMGLDAEAATRAEQAKTEEDNQLAQFLEYAENDDQIAKYMANYGYEKNEDGVWVDKDGNPASKYIQTMAEYASGNMAQEEETAVEEMTFSAANGTQYTTMMPNGSGLNNNVTVQVGDALYRVEMSNGYITDAEGKKLTQSDLQVLFKDRKNGEMWLCPADNGTYWILMKDGNGKIRRIEKRGSNVQDVINLARQLGLSDSEIAKLNDSNVHKYGNESVTPPKGESNNPLLK